MGYGDNCVYVFKGVVVDLIIYDWEDDKFLEIFYVVIVIYEMYVGGFICNFNFGVVFKKWGIFVGLVEKIFYFKELGIIAVELLFV